MIARECFSWILRFLGWLLVVSTLGFGIFCLSACGSLPASRDYVDQRIEDMKTDSDTQDAKVQAALRDAAVEVAEFVDPIFPGYARAVERVYDGKEVTSAPLPPRQDPFPWEVLLTTVGAALGVGVPASVAATNRIRDGKRKQRGEALTPAEAAAKGYYEEGRTTA